MKTNGSEKAKHRFVLSILLVLVLGACASQTPNASPPPPTATPIQPTPTPTVAPTPIERDYWPTDGWRTSTPEEQGMDSEQLAELMDYLLGQESFTIHSLLIIRNGYIVTDATFYPFAPDSLHDLASATKSFMSTLIGIAIDQGYIESVEQPVLDFFFRANRGEPGRCPSRWDQGRDDAERPFDHEIRLQVYQPAGRDHFI